MKAKLARLDADAEPIGLQPPLRLLGQPGRQRRLVDAQHVVDLPGGDPFRQGRFGGPTNQRVDPLLLDQVVLDLVVADIVLNDCLEIDQVMIAGQELAGRRTGILGTGLIADLHAANLVHRDAIDAVDAPGQAEEQAGARRIDHPAKAADHRPFARADEDHAGQQVGREQDDPRDQQQLSWLHHDLVLVPPMGKRRSRPSASGS